MQAVEGYQVLLVKNEFINVIASLNRNHCHEEDEQIVRVTDGAANKINANLYKVCLIHFSFFNLDCVHIIECLIKLIKSWRSYDQVVFNR